MSQCSGILQMPAIQLFFQLSSNFIFAAFILQSDSSPTEFCFHQAYLPPTLLRMHALLQNERTRLCRSHWLSVRLKHILRPGKISSLNKETDGGAIISIFCADYLNQLSNYSHAARVFSDLHLFLLCFTLDFRITTKKRKWPYGLYHHIQHLEI